jgi:hypothetical protein
MSYPCLKPLNLPGKTLKEYWFPSALGITRIGSPKQEVDPLEALIRDPMSVLILLEHFGGE